MDLINSLFLTQFELLNTTTRMQFLNDIYIHGGMEIDPI